MTWRVEFFHTCGQQLEKFMFCKNNRTVGIQVVFITKRNSNILYICSILHVTSWETRKKNYKRNWKKSQIRYSIKIQEHCGKFFKTTTAETKEKEETKEELVLQSIKDVKIKQWITEETWNVEKGRNILKKINSEEQRIKYRKLNREIQRLSIQDKNHHTTQIDEVLEVWWKYWENLYKEDVGPEEEVKTTTFHQRRGTETRYFKRQNSTAHLLFKKQRKHWQGQYKRRNAKQLNRKAIYLLWRICDNIWKTEQWPKL